MNQLDGERPDERRVDGFAAWEIPRALHAVHALVELLYEARNLRRIVLVVAVDGDNALISFLQRARVDRTKL